MKRLLPILLVAVAVIAVGGWLWLSPSSNSATVSEANAAEELSLSDDAVFDGIEEMMLGAPDAPVTIIEYASLTCPHCRTFHEGAFKSLKQDYIDTGKVRFVFREVYFDRPGLWASIVARCAGPTRFFAVIDMIFERQTAWARAGDSAAIAQGLRRLGAAAGLSQGALDACLQDAQTAQALVAWSESNTSTHNINATPSFVINGVTYQNMSYADLSSTIDELI